MRVEKYIELIQEFVDKKICIQDFESKFFSEFKNEKEGIEENLYQILEAFFEDLDCYDSSITSEMEDIMNITEATLRGKAVETLEELKTYLSSKSL